MLRRLIRQDEALLFFLRYHRIVVALHSSPFLLITWHRDEGDVLSDLNARIRTSGSKSRICQSRPLGRRLYATTAPVRAIANTVVIHAW